MKSKKLGLIRIAAHDFRRSLRVWVRHLEPTVIFEKLCHERHRASTAFMRSAALALAALLWLGANRNELVLKIAFLDLPVPAAYVNAAAALLIVGVVLNFVNYLTLNEFVRVASNYLFKFDAPWALSVVYDGSDAWNIGNLEQHRFFKSSRTHRGVVFVYLLFLNLPIFILLVTGYAIIIGNGWNTLIKDGLFTMGGLVTVVGWILLVQAALMMVCLFARFTFAKNLSFIRWLFLYKIYRRMGVWHPRIPTWR